MKLVIKLDYSTWLAVPAEHAGILVPAFSTGILVTKTGYKATDGYKPREGAAVEFSFEPDTKFEEAPEAFTALQKSRDESESKYLKEWTAKTAVEKELKELKAELAKLKDAVTAASPAPSKKDGEDSPF